MKLYQMNLNGILYDKKITVKINKGGEKANRLANPTIYDKYIYACVCIYTCIWRRKDKNGIYEKLYCSH